MMHARLRSAALASAVSAVMGTLVAIGGPAGSAHAATHRVIAVPRDFATIQAAVNAAAPGDTVNVGAGTYTEQVVINKDLNVHGAGMSSTVIRAPFALASYGVRVSDSTPLAAIVQVGNHANVHLSGVNVTGPVPCTSVDEGIGVVEDANLDVSDTRISQLISPGCSGEAYGMVFGVSPSYAINGVPGGSTASGHVSHVVVDTFQTTGIIVVGPFGRSPSRVTLADNTVSGGAPVDPADQVGIWVRLNAVGQVTGSTISGLVCSYDGCGFDPIAEFQSIGVVVERADGSNVSGNHVSRADVGILDNAANVTVNDNRLVANNMIGLVVFDANGVTKNNTITGGRVGIGAAAATQDTTVLSSGDHISGVSDSATQTFECCGFHASVTVRP